MPQIKSPAKVLKLWKNAKKEFEKKGTMPSANEKTNKGILEDMKKLTTFANKEEVNGEGVPERFDATRDTLVVKMKKFRKEFDSDKNHPLIKKYYRNVGALIVVVKTLDLLELEDESEDQADGDIGALDLLPDQEEEVEGEKVSGPTLERGPGGVPKPPPSGPRPPVTKPKEKLTSAQLGQKGFQLAAAIQERMRTITKSAKAGQDPQALIAKDPALIKAKAELAEIVKATDAARDGEDRQANAKKLEALRGIKDPKERNLASGRLAAQTVSTKEEANARATTALTKAENGLNLALDDLAAVELEVREDAEKRANNKNLPVDKDLQERLAKAQRAHAEAEEEAEEAREKAERTSAAERKARDQTNGLIDRLARENWTEEEKGKAGGFEKVMNLARVDLEKKEDRLKDEQILADRDARFFQADLAVLAQKEESLQEADATVVKLNKELLEHQKILQQVKAGKTPSKETLAAAEGNVKKAQLGVAAALKDQKHLQGLVSDAREQVKERTKTAEDSNAKALKTQLDATLSARTLALTNKSSAENNAKAADRQLGQAKDEWVKGIEKDPKTGPLWTEKQGAEKKVGDSETKLKEAEKKLKEARAKAMEQGNIANLEIDKARGELSGAKRQRDELQLKAMDAVAKLKEAQNRKPPVPGGELKQLQAVATKAQEEAANAKKRFAAAQEGMTKALDIALVAESKAFTEAQEEHQKNVTASGELQKKLDEAILANPALQTAQENIEVAAGVALRAAQEKEAAEASLTAQLGKVAVNQVLLDCAAKRNDEAEAFGWLKGLDTFEGGKHETKDAPSTWEKMAKEDPQYWDKLAKCDAMMEELVNRDKVLEAAGVSVEERAKLYEHIPRGFWPDKFIEELRDYREVTALFGEEAEEERGKDFDKAAAKKKKEAKRTEFVNGMMQELQDSKEVGAKALNAVKTVVDWIGDALGPVDGEEVESIKGICELIGQGIEGGDLVAEEISTLDEYDEPAESLLELRLKKEKLTGFLIEKLTPNMLKTGTNIAKGGLEIAKGAGVELSKHAAAVVPGLGAVLAAIDLAFASKELVLKAKLHHADRGLSKEVGDDDSTMAKSIGNAKGQTGRLVAKNTINVAAKGTQLAGSIATATGVGAPAGAIVTVVGKGVEHANKGAFAIIDMGLAAKAKQVLEDARAGSRTAMQEVFKHHQKYATMFIVKRAKEGEAIAMKFCVSRGLHEREVLDSNASMLLIRQFLLEKVEQTDDMKTAGETASAWWDTLCKGGKLLAAVGKGALDIVTAGNGDTILKGVQGVVNKFMPDKEQVTIGGPTTGMGQVQKWKVKALVMDQKKPEQLTEKDWFYREAILKNLKQLEPTLKEPADVKDVKEVIETLSNPKFQPPKEYLKAI